MLWFLLLILIAAEIAALWWWLNHEYYPVIFNGWAVSLYVFAIAADATVVWLIASVFDRGASSGFATIAIFAYIALFIIVALTFFLRWVVRQDLPGAPK